MSLFDAIDIGSAKEVESLLKERSYANIKEAIVRAIKIGYKEIVEILGRKEGTIKSLLHRGLEKLKELVE